MTEASSAGGGAERPVQEVISQNAHKVKLLRKNTLAFFHQ